MHRCWYMSQSLLFIVQSCDRFSLPLLTIWLGGVRVNTMLRKISRGCSGCLPSKIWANLCMLVSLWRRMCNPWMIKIPWRASITKTLFGLGGGFCKRRDENALVLIAGISIQGVVLLYCFPWASCQKTWIQTCRRSPMVCQGFYRMKTAICINCLFVVVVLTWYTP